MPRRQHHSEIVSIKAECQRCTWTADAKNAQALAAQHHDQKGHRVEVVTTTKLIYGASLGATRKDGKQGSLSI